MNILLCSVPFRPSVGGIETVSELLAERFHRLGHQVTVVTQTLSNLPDTDAFVVVRRPSAGRLFALVRQSDVVFHNNISLRLAWPLLLLRRPWVVAHHTWIARQGLAARVKRVVMRYASNIAVSRAVASALSVRCAIIPNPYADDVFVRMNEVLRTKELVFVGRLVSDKGVHLLIDALTVLRQRGRRAGLTIIGDGPELAALRRRAADQGVDGQIDFAGRRVGLELVTSLNEHEVLVVPSVWQEPFGVVVLEAMACGCVPLVARSGGLPEAIGSGGVVFPAGDSVALASSIDELLSVLTRLDGPRHAAPAHLERHTRDHVAREYLQVLSDACRKNTTHRTATVA